MNRLSLRSRVLMSIAALMLVAAQFLPIWKIELHAPQYPEGIGMLIRMDTLTGMKPADIDNLNGLNHYIGMQAIHAESFPALKVMPAIAAALAGFALVVALAGRRAVLVAWLGTMMIAGAAGFAEFFRWSYRYGHDLAPDAIIKVPGMTYQPPILGSKQLLNFTATSWPAPGGWLAVGAFLLGVIALLPLARSRSAKTAVASVTARIAPVVAALLLVITSGCTTQERPVLEYGRADCAVCQMRIVDKRYGGAAITEKGKTNQFDSIECLANYTRTVANLRSVWVSDFDHPGTLIDATTARFVRKEGPSADMGANVFAFESATSEDSIKSRFGVPSLSWSDVQALAERDLLRAGTSGDSSGAAHVH